MSGVLYEEIFDIKDVDPEGKQFERVQRIHAECESSKMELILDVNSLLYVPHTGEKVCQNRSFQISALIDTSVVSIDDYVNLE